MFDIAKGQNWEKKKPHILNPDPALYGHLHGSEQFPRFRSPL